MMKNKPSKECLIELYINKRLSAGFISKDYNLSDKSIYNLLREYDIPRRNKRELGLMRLDYLRGKRFGKLVVINRAENPKYKESRWNCLCDCGKNKIVRARSLLDGHSTSCGCIRAGYEEISKSHINQIKNNAKRKNRQFTITPKYMWDLFIQQNRKCSLSGIPIKFGSKYKKIETTASLDRIDSSKGYIENNVQWVHKDVNTLKTDFSDTDFLKWVNLIHDYKNVVKV